MQEQIVLQVTFPKGEKQHLEKYRGLIANIGAKTLPNVLFWRDDNEKTLQSRPEVRWVHAPGGFSILASDSYGDEVNSATAELLAAFMNAGLGEFKVSKITRHVDAQERDEIFAYKAINVLFDATERGVKKHLGADKKEKQLIIQDYIRKQLLMEAEAFGVDESLFEQCKSHILVQSVKEIAPKKIICPKSKEVKRVIARMDVVFTMPVKLLGTWQVGRQVSKGYGRVLPTQEAFHANL
jgi:hypothetical protein